jgi:hypothetical protein
VYDIFARGGVPFAADVASSVAIAVDDVVAAYERLAARHVFVLQPHSREIWMAMPFSALQTPFRLVSGDRAWWAGCAWDALGIAAALDITAVVHTACPDCDAQIQLAVHNGAAADDNVCCHFAVPAARWWDDIAET